MDFPRTPKERPYFHSLFSQVQFEFVSITKTTTTSTETSQLASSPTYRLTGWKIKCKKQYLTNKKHEKYNEIKNSNEIDIIKKKSTETKQKEFEQVKKETKQEKKMKKKAENEEEKSKKFFQ